MWDYWKTTEVRKKKQNHGRKNIKSRRKTK